MSQSEVAKLNFPPRRRTERVKRADHSDRGGSMMNPVLKTPVAAKGQSDIKDRTGTHGREVKRRMRSRFQKGTLQKAGNQVLVRYRVDTPDGRRVLTSEKVCDLVNGKPTLSLAEQRRRAAEIVAAAGVNSTEQIKQNILGLTFRQQAEAFLKQAQVRKRSPISNNTYHTWRSCLDKWLLPNIGNTLLQDVNNKLVKELVVKMVDAELAPKTVENYLGLVKLVVASAIDENGEEIYPRKWNHDFIDLPEVDEQNTPTVTAEQLT